MLFEEMPKKKEIKLSTVIITAVVIFIVILIIMAVIILGGSNKEPDQPIVNNPTIQNNNVENTNTPVSITSEASEFPIDFLKLENQKQNIIYSPLSIKYALNMLNEGTNGNTKKQIDNVIGELTLRKYTNKENVLSLANTIYVKDEYRQYIKESYQNTLLQKYNAEINYDTFENAQNINQWIENKTMGIIKDMLQDNKVKMNRILLINALAIDMEWQTAFDPNETHGEEFNLEDGNQMVATMMQRKSKKEDVAYYKDMNMTAISMDLKQYDNTQLEFMAIMPNEDLSNYVKNVTINDINQVIKKLKPASQANAGIEIKIPKFSFDYSLRLKQHLMSLGITDAFNSSLANFSNMADMDFHVSDALHKANIDFSEEGIKAAAVTVFTKTDSDTIPEEEPEEIKFDKPFMYMIREKKTGEIWFVGTVYEPNSWEKDQADYQAR
ncbi:MAG: serpin family protein [Clostridia bacterium]|nr:serpin family protein [Clostridia bacterium]MCI9413293.1 serpin family protein [Clostridia bacterium]